MAPRYSRRCLPAHPGRHRRQVEHPRQHVGLVSRSSVFSCITLHDAHAARRRRFPAFVYVTGFAAWIWIRKGRKFLLKNELAHLDAINGANPTGESPSPEINSEKEKEIEADERVEYRA